VGKTLPVLFEQTNEAGNWTGHSPNYILVEAPGEDLHNQIRTVRITAVTERGLTGILAD
jgi:hypothetical protein